jgi:predicted nucleotidyltransferase
MTTPADKLPDIAITPEQWQIVATVLQKHVPDKEVWAFGSRATHTEKPYSDLDLVIVSDTGLSLSQLAAIENDFSESDLPFKVDVVDSAAISPAFRGMIESHRVRIQ